ncbi:short-chain dehydrogenase, partial [Pseudomonas aeruginosa]
MRRSPCGGSCWRVLARNDRQSGASASAAALAGAAILPG